MTTTELTISRNGQRVITGTKTFTAADKIVFLVTDEGTTFSTCEDVDGNSLMVEDFTSAYEWGAGKIISADNQGLIGSIVVTAGGVQAIIG
jgi:hypothetical protein